MYTYVVKSIEDRHVRDMVLGSSPTALALVL